MVLLILVRNPATTKKDFCVLNDLVHIFATLRGYCPLLKQEWRWSLPFQTNQHSPAMTKCQNVYMRAEESTKQWFTDKLANLFNHGRLSNVWFGGDFFFWHNNFIDLYQNFDIMWISQVNDLWNICFRSGESDRMPLKYEVNLFPNYSFVT